MIQIADGDYLHVDIIQLDIAITYVLPVIVH